MMNAKWLTSYILVFYIEQQRPWWDSLLIQNISIFTGSKKMERYVSIKLLDVVVTDHNTASYILPPWMRCANNGSRKAESETTCGVLPLTPEYYL